MFDKILIANRGEIACRVIRTARRMGVATVAVYSDADAEAPHVRLADEAVRLGPPPAAESYLDQAKILDACRATGAQAVHPGYGFLSENAAFAEACAAAGIVFIGPPPDAIRVMGSKSESKRLMAQAGVPLVPGYHGEEQDDARLAAAAEEIGFPVLVKASAGGGGKGMRVVRAAGELQAALEGARREAKAAFGDDTLLVEKYLEQPRHVEMQVFADTHGNAVHLFERDCSIQRRHQKIIEEAPAPGLDEAVRARLGEAAVAAAKAIGYVGAGTVEFLYAGGEVYFIEMNTRLQVEHPVTEMITGLDLVEWQLRVAAGAPLPLAQEAITRHGHAFEARVYAEDPDRDFLPATGTLLRLRPPAPGPHVRVDAGVAEGGAVTPHYDPMIAKLIVWDEDRAAAVRRLRRALRAFEVVGVTTNLGFLSAVAEHPAFADGEVETGFIDRHRAALLPPPAEAPAEVVALAALAVMLRREDEAAAAARRSADPCSPWNAVSGWRLNDDNHHDLAFEEGGARHAVTVHFRRRGWRLDLPGREAPVIATAERDADGVVHADLGGHRLRAPVVLDGLRVTVLHGGRVWRLLLDDPTAAAAALEEGGAGLLTAPMPGKVVAVLVETGAAVKAGQPLMVLEAMKMEHTITAPGDGTVAEIRFNAGDQVSDGDQLLVLDLDEEG